MDETVGVGVGPTERAHHAGGDGPTPEPRRRMSARRKRGDPPCGWRQRPGVVKESTDALLGTCLPRRRYRRWPTWLWRHLLGISGDRANPILRLSGAAGGQPRRLRRPRPATTHSVTLRPAAGAPPVLRQRSLRAAHSHRAPVLISQGIPIETPETYAHGHAQAEEY